MADAAGRGSLGAVGRILIVDDSPSARRLLQDILLHLGIGLPDLRVATTIDEALVLFTQWRPDVAIVDVELGRDAAPPAAKEGNGRSDPADGAELAQLFLHRNPALKVVLCSATDVSDPRVQSLRRGRDVEFVMKPILAARMRQILAGMTKHPPADGPR